jgi:hypothetical protein
MIMRVNQMLALLACSTSANFGRNNETITAGGREDKDLLYHIKDLRFFRV